MSGEYRGDERKRTARQPIVGCSGAVRIGVVQALREEPGRKMFTVPAATGDWAAGTRHWLRGKT